MYNGTCVSSLLGSNLSYENAISNCHAAGGTIYTPMTDHYTEVLIEWRKRLFPDKKGNVPMWANILQTEPERYEFMNVKGIMTDEYYNNWAPNEPNVGFDCVIVRPEDGKWKTQPCKNKAYSICYRDGVFSHPIFIYIPTYYTQRLYIPCYFYFI